MVIYVIKLKTQNILYNIKKITYIHDMKDDLQDIVDRMSYVGMLDNCSEAKLNQYIITGTQPGDNTVNTRIGRIVQIRKCDGSDYLGDATVLLRHLNGRLTSHTNQSYIPLKENYLERVKKAFEDANVKLDDPINTPYSIMNKDSVKGFIVTEEDIEAQKKLDERNKKIENLTD